MTRVLGIMSGTSCDGLDCCDVQINLDESYNFSFQINSFNTIEYTKEEKKYLLSVRKKYIKNKKNESQKITEIFMSKIDQFSNNISKFDLISCHGHTVKHIDRVLSLQLLEGSMMFEKYKVPITCNFREADIQKNGNGAPLMPFLDFLLFSKIKKNVVTLNIGGISNISFIPINSMRSDVLGFDTGPGMSLIDKSTKIFFNDFIDTDSQYSIKGKVNEVLLDYLMSNKYIKLEPPKSTDVNNFGYEYLQRIINKFPNLSNYDIVRTLVCFTSESILYNIKKFININNFELIYSGGGTEHPIIMKELHKKIKNLYPISSYGIDTSIKEALLMAVLGVARVKNIASNMPSVTGSTGDTVLGVIYE